ncbi:hypothetical protein LB467_17795 [Salegentibacter sp. JZCK2]|uniref:hypothetical protein n=1 Tax=Salegentibacter tibetensis TaxID=2873600 RepID=UPI001CCBF01B|nr:hypothetical protein [Salegentibacter tibetensis]MBZ9731542.1 hypothetical protein [Salegentibacter tibetensis]
MINAAKLENYINTFFGYGNWNATYWFIGIEENGGYSPEDVNLRIDSWEKYGTELIDCKRHHVNIGLKRFFTEGLRQKTWWGLIRLRNTIEGKEISTETIRSVQKENWGQIKSSNLLIDLFPLPSPSVELWNYRNWYTNEWDNLGLTYLKTREKYFEKISKKRIKRLKEKLNKHKPRVVIFYASSLIHFWEEVMGKSFKKEGEKYKIGRYYIRLLQTQNTLFVQIPQTSVIRNNEWFISVGAIIRERMVVEDLQDLKTVE